MRDKELKKHLRQYFQQEVKHDHADNMDQKHDNAGSMDPKHDHVMLEETIRLCTEIMREQISAKRSKEEPRIGFVQYLSDIFRFEGVSIFGLQAAALLILCVAIYRSAGDPRDIPAFMPLFVLAVMPAIFKCQYYGMSEMEAVTRASGSQIVLAKLILVGAADLICMTFLVSFEVYLQSSCRDIGRIILYCMVPYLVCMAGMLRLLRWGRKENMQICVTVSLGSCVCWGVLAKTLPWLYDASAFGIWIAAFLFFAVFFIKEIYLIITVRKEGKMYGIIS